MSLIDVRSHLEPDGFCIKWLDYCEPKEFPESYGLFSLLAVTAAAVNGRIIINPETTPSPPPNMYVLLYGPSGARKGEALRTAQSLLEDAVPEAPILPDDFNMEALTEYLAQESAEYGKCGGWVLSEEFSDLIGGADYMKRNTIFLTKLYDARPFQTRLTIAHDLQTIKSPYVVIGASVSTDWLDGVNPKALAGGFLRRLLIIAEFVKRQHRSSGFMDQNLYHRIRKLYRDRLGPKAFNATYMRLTPESRRVMDEWYEGPLAVLANGVPEREGHFVSCMQAHMLKLACLINVLEGRGPEWLEVPSVSTAIGLLDAIRPGIFQVYASLVPTPYARLRAAIIRTVQGFGKTGGEPADVDRAVVRGTGVKPTEAAKTRQQMILDGDLVIRRKRVMVPEG